MATAGDVATRLGLPSVSYYGARNAPFLTETPLAPVMFHFGERDAGDVGTGGGGATRPLHSVPVRRSGDRAPP